MFIPIKKYCTSQTAVWHAKGSICGKYTRPMSSKRQEVKNVGKYVEKRELLCNFGGNVTGYDHYGNSMDPQNVKNRTAI